MITITEAAKTRIKTQLLKNSSSKGIRFTVKPTGCSGYAYSLEFVEEVIHSDTLHSDIDFNFYIATEATKFFTDLVIDYQKKGLNEEFVFINPKESARCGCGESFTI